MATNRIWIRDSPRKIGGVRYAEEPHNSRVQAQMVSCPERNGGKIDLMCGAVWSDFELGDFAFSVQKKMSWICNCDCTICIPRAR